MSYHDWRIAAVRILDQKNIRVTAFKLTELQARELEMFTDQRERLFGIRVVVKREKLPSA